MGAPVVYHVPQKFLSCNEVESKQIACGRSFTALLTNNGKVYTWGKGRDGALGNYHDFSWNFLLF